MEQSQSKIKPKAKIEHLINWYHGNFCVKHEDCTREHYEELKRIALSWNIPEMTHKEFCNIIRQELKCNSNKRKIDDCPICRKLGIPQWKF
ncbi:hypothetical protein J4455_00885 [Candidatus Woesearchaeota archaeon]|nr:hypothetical protein [Candidatus Woesearchaeota archaeon]